MSAACHYLDRLDKEAMMKSELQIQREIDAEHERDEDRAIYGMMVLIAGIGLAIMIGIAVIGAWAQ